MLLSAAARADDGIAAVEAVAAARTTDVEDMAGLVATAPMPPAAPWIAVADTLAQAPADVDVGAVLATIAMPSTMATMPSRPLPDTASSAGFARDSPRAPADGDRDAPAPGPSRHASDGEERPNHLRVRLHADDAANGSGFADLRIRTFSLALDAVMPRSGLTIQPRVQLAYQPRDDGLPNPALAAMPPDAASTGLALRVYGAQPTRLAGVYPFVEADWWQDSRKQTININGTRIDTDLLRGLFSFNIGAHGSTRTGVKVWIKIKTGRNAGGIIGARYRW